MYKKFGYIDIIPYCRVVIIVEQVFSHGLSSLADFYLDVYTEKNIKNVMSGERKVKRVCAFTRHDFLLKWNTLRTKQ